MTALGPDTRQHPRLRHYPHHLDYLGLVPEFRPFVMFTDQANYRSTAVNTDKFGLREQYEASGEFIDLEAIRFTHPHCNVLLGGSTVFGVDASSDRATLSHRLHRGRTPCLNLGFRAATSQQELIMFLLFKRYLNGVLNVVLLSGVNDCALAARPGTRLYPGLGGVFYEAVAPNALRQQELFGVSRYRAGRIVDGMFVRSRVFRGVMKLLLGRSAVASRETPKGFDDKLTESMALAENTIHTWGLLQSGAAFKVHFVLQPAIGWTKKPLSALERDCFEADAARLPELRLISSTAAYDRCRQALAASCERNGIEFHDANDWLNESRFAAEDVFTDVCHLNDNGNRIIADLLMRRLTWSDGEC